MKQLSVVLPIHNHADFLERVITQVENILQEASIDFELLLVENGSTDSSWEVCQRLSQQSERIIALQTSPGYGRAIIAGLKRATGTIVGYSEANGLIYPNVIPYLVWLIEDGHCDFAKGLRIKRETTFRSVQSKVYNFIANVAFHLHLSDSNTCPKLFPREFLEKFNLENQRSFIDLEIMIKAKYLGMNILEVPIPYVPRAGGKSLTSWKTIFQFVSGIFTWRFSKLRQWKKGLPNQETFNSH